MGISIHAPPRGATKSAFAADALANHFNSRPSARGDCICTGACGASTLFQFTPLREGRLRILITFFDAGEFQFTPLREGRQTSQYTWKHLGEFQFTPLREGRLLPCNISVLKIYFNSRPSARGDARYDADGREIENFNSRPSARGDWVATRFRGGAHLFQFTPLREGRRTMPLYRRDLTLISIHAPPRGAT